MSENNKTIKHEKVEKGKYKAIKGYKDDDPEQPIFSIVKLSEGEAIIIELLESIGAKLKA